MSEETTPDTTSETTPKKIPEMTPESATHHDVKPDKKPNNKAVIISIFLVVGILITLVIGAFGGILIQKALSPNATPALTSGVDGNTTVTKEENDIAAVAAKVNPSVVSIVGATGGSYYGATSGEAAGTGIIVSSNGYVMTNNHVIENSRNISVIDSEGNQYKNVTVIGNDPLNDIAFLKIKSDKTFTPVEFGNSATIRIGQQVVAIGNALGQYSNTVTSGIISGTGRPVAADDGTGQLETLNDLIQTDASINPGNSGGPLVNMAGQVVGINTAIAKDASGIGFAIPINSTKGVLAGVLENGKVSRSFLGVSYITITPDVADQYNLSVKKGAYVHNQNSNPVSSGSPAEKAGLKADDIIVKVNNSVIGENGNLSSILGEYRPGDKVTLTILRDGKSKTVDVTLAAYKE